MQLTQHPELCKTLYCITETVLSHILCQSTEDEIKYDARLDVGVGDVKGE